MSSIIDFTLGVVKVLVGSMSNSYALVVDGIHSLSDLLTDLMVWLFNEISVQAPDQDHPYGHARFEPFGTLILGVLLIGLSIFIVYDSAERLLTIETYSTPAWPALLVAIISIASKEWLYQLTFRIGKKTKSRLLQANAWHHRTDALSSIIVFIGIGSALLGFPWLELIAAIGVAVMIAIIGWSLSKQSVSELVDTALAASYVDEIRAQIEDMEGVQGVHSIRTRSMGADALVDIHLQVNPGISVSEGHQIGEWVTRRLRIQFPEVNDVIVHIDPEDDEYLDVKTIDELAPLRRDVHQLLLEAWQLFVPEHEINKMTLHYLNNQIHVEIFLGVKSHNASDTDQLRQNLLKAGDHLPWLQQVSIWYE